MPPVIDPQKCTHCGTCADICNSDIFDRSRKNVCPEVKFPDECWHCEACVLDCPSGAISLRFPLSYSVMHIPVSMLHDNGGKSNA